MKYETKEQALAALEAVNGKHKMEVCDLVFLCVFPFEFFITNNRNGFLELVLESSCRLTAMQQLHDKFIDVFKSLLFIPQN